jgi:hypothetical protein
VSRLARNQSPDRSAPCASTRRLLHVVLALALCSSLTATFSAQGRFAVVGDDLVGYVSGLRILTIRDNATGSCTMLFVLDPGLSGALSDRSSPPASPPPQEMATARDHRLAELRATLDAVSNPLAAGLPPPSPLAFDWEADKANTEYLAAALDHAIARLEARLDRIVQPLQLVSSAPGPCPAANTR